MRANSITLSIDGATQLLGIIGDPLEKAKTPTLITPLLASGRFGKNIVLVPLRVPDGHLGEVLHGLRQVGNFRGTVITMPHKQAAKYLADEVSEEAEIVGACNVIRFDRNRRIMGTMLDGEGFVASLREQGHALEGRSILLIGAGGVAAGIAYALTKAGAARLTITNRNMERAEALAKRLSAQIQTAGHPHACDFDIIVNATSLGMGAGDVLPISLDGLKPSTLVCDVVVAVEKTAFLKEAEDRGCQTHVGSHMLNAQLERVLEYILQPDT